MGCKPWNDVTLVAKTNCGLFGFDAGNALGTDRLIVVSAGRTHSKPKRCFLTPAYYFLAFYTAGLPTRCILDQHQARIQRRTPPRHLMTTSVSYIECSMRCSRSRSLAPG